MTRPRNPDACTPRRGLGGVCLLMLVAMTLSAGLAGAEWARLPGSQRESAPTSRLGGSMAHTACRAERKQTIKPAHAALWALPALSVESAQTTVAPVAHSVPGPRRLRASLLSLPPPAIA